MKLTLINDFHKTETTVYAKNNTINQNQIKRAKKRLCGISTCCCGGIRGRQSFSFDIDYNSKGEEIFINITPEIDNDRNKY